MKDGMSFNHARNSTQRYSPIEVKKGVSKSSVQFGILFLPIWKKKKNDARNTYIGWFYLFYIRCELVLLQC